MTGRSALRARQRERLTGGCAISVRESGGCTSARIDLVAEIPQATAANAFSKKVEHHVYALAVYFMHYNFVRIHQTTGVTPAMAAGVTDTLWEIADIVRVVDEWEKTK